VSDELLPYYQRELAFIRKMGAEFAREHPDIAAGLRLGPDACEDPHVERLIMAFAYLAARIRHKLDDDFPEITDALLGVLYPHFLAPIPSMAIVEFQLDRGQGGLVEGFRIDRGSQLETEAVDGEPCRFRTSYPVTLWPFEITAAGLSSIASSPAFVRETAAGVLRLELQCFAKDLTFAKLKLPRLRVFLNGQPQHVFALYELLFNNVLELTLANSGKDPQPLLLGKVNIRPVGFEEDEWILPYPPRSFPGYRLLSEYFAFPSKFCFFDITGLSPQLLSGLGNKVELCFYLDRTAPDLEQNVSAKTFRLGCTPVVNLYQQRSEPIALTQLQTEYRLVADARRPLATEIYSVDRVIATSPRGEDVEYHPFYSFKHSVTQKDQKTFWHATRRPSTRAETGDRVDHGTEVYLHLVDLAFNPGAPADWTVAVETTCLNRDLPRRLPFGPGKPLLGLAEGGPLSSISCLTAPTATLRPQFRTGSLWRILSHLSLNHLSLVDREGSPDALREILKVYDYHDSGETRSKIDGITRVRGRRVVSRIPGDGGGGFCKGLEVEILFDEERFSDNGLFLFASVLERFLGLYTSINSFTQFIITTKQRQKVLRKWPPRTAHRALL
jgi:type VI secretion system protein ImpG